MRKLFLNISTVYKLGLTKVAYVAWYKFSLKSGLRKLHFPVKVFENIEQFFTGLEPRIDFPEEWKDRVVYDANRLIEGNIRYFSYQWKDVGNPPNWFLNPFNGSSYRNTHLHWTLLPDFHPIAGDIKNIWEASRFDWVVTLARAYAITGENKYLNTLNSWLKDWMEKNPLNSGPNWKCGQEASIRLFNLLNAAFILNQQAEPSRALVKFVEGSLHRISKNIHYAIAQDNNHGTSEAAGLYIGGLWLSKVDPDQTNHAKKSAEKGRSWLENRMEKLVTDSGSFSQHSLTYHRVLMDTICFVEFWRKTLNDKPFSVNFYRKAKSAALWLFQLTDQISGNAPNLGSNDGASLLNFHTCDYRNFRPTLQLAGRLFFSDNWLNHGNHNEPLYWLKLDPSGSLNPPLKENFSDHGYATIHGQNSWALIKWPYYKFRPSHNDVFHIDLWYNGMNILCDSGTYSYNPEPSFGSDLKLVHSHNTVSFDHNDQMPKLGRFLLGSWLKADSVKLAGPSTTTDGTWSGSYHDSSGNRHDRTVQCKGNHWKITDTLSGQFKLAIIGFNLNSISCKLDGHKLDGENLKITFENVESVQLKDTIVSEYYQQARHIPRVEALVVKPGTYITRIELLSE